MDGVGFGIKFFEVQVKNRSIRTVWAGLLYTGLVVGWTVLQSGNGEAQVAPTPLVGVNSNFLANVSWDQTDSAIMFGPQQDQSMPAYRAPKPPKPQAGTPDSEA